MDGAQEFTRWSEDSAPLPQTRKTRRSIPPELVHATDLERLYFTLHIKGLPFDSVTLTARARRLGVGFSDRADEGAMGVNAALRELARRTPRPALSPSDDSLRRRGQDLERWACTEVAQAVIWSLLQPVKLEADAAPAAPIRNALDLIAGLTRRHSYVLGADITLADITLAAVLAPIARRDGWVWAGRLWTPLAQLAGRSVLAAHPGAAWVRNIYERHVRAEHAAPDATRSWMP